MAKAVGLPLYKFLGGVRNSMETDMTIMIDSPSAMAEKAADIVAKGFGMLKVKAGINPDEDIEAIRQIRERVGSMIDIKVDANQGWSVGESIRIMDAATCSRGIGRRTANPLLGSRRPGLHPHQDAPEADGRRKLLHAAGRQFPGKASGCGHNKHQADEMRRPV
jgi:hypothetical protein